MQHPLAEMRLALKALEGAALIATVDFTVSQSRHQTGAPEKAAGRATAAQAHYAIRAPMMSCRRSNSKRPLPCLHVFVASQPLMGAHAACTCAAHSDVCEEVPMTCERFQKSLTGFTLDPSTSCSTARCIDMRRIYVDLICSTTTLLFWMQVCTRQLILPGSLTNKQLAPSICGCWRPQHRPCGAHR
jgi:hypothetical protein